VEILRLKAVSSCIGIRRTSIAYFLYDGNMTYDVSEYEHPLNSIKSIKFDNHLVSFLDKENESADMIPFTLKATSLGSEVSEICYLDIKLMDINDQNVEFIKKNIDDVVNEQPGEYEFIIGFYYLNNKEEEKSQEYFKASHDKGFKLASKYFKN
jgi:hypothetical protein